MARAVTAMGRALSSLLAVVAWLGAGCFAEHQPSDAGLDAPPPSCEPEPGLFVARSDGLCACPPDELRSFRRDDEPEWVCSGVTNSNAARCSISRIPSNGLVCSSYLEHAMPAAAPKNCLYHFARLGFSPPPPGTCVYADATGAVTGEVPDVDCTESLRASGLCGVNCPCADGDVCVGPSELHPIGVCARPSPTVPGHLGCTPELLRGSSCEIGDRCMTPAARPAWLSDVFWAVLDPDPELGGACVPEDRCRALDERYPGVWQCRLR